MEDRHHVDWQLELHDHTTTQYSAGDALALTLR